MAIFKRYYFVACEIEDITLDESWKENIVISEHPSALYLRMINSFQTFFIRKWDRISRKQYEKLKKHNPTKEESYIALLKRDYREGEE